MDFDLGGKLIIGVDAFGLTYLEADYSEDEINDECQRRYSKVK